MINTFVFLHLSAAGLHDRTDLSCFSRSVCPGVIPPQAWMVNPVAKESEIQVLSKGSPHSRARFVGHDDAPFMLHAAIPVLAITDIAVGVFLYFIPSPMMIAPSSIDFPVPNRRADG